ncbi:hypothetical protein FRC08_012374 [Ceratobasidium sp. 394]|nr:hypothetical protein FRC08_012374 [Ceratobasidium sp. 394]
MAPVNTLTQLAATTIRLAQGIVSPSLKLKFEYNLRRLFYKLLEYGLLASGLRGSPVLFAQPDTPSTVGPIPSKRLPSFLRYMPQARKSTLRATYERETKLFPAGSAQLPRAQRSLATPITLSGSDGAINIALRPLAAQVGLGYEYQPEPTPCPTPRVSTYINNQAEVRATLRGATAVLEALVRGAVDKEWLNEPAIESKPVFAPRMVRSYAREGSPRMLAGSYARPSGAKLELGQKMDEIASPGQLGGTRSRESSGSGSSSMSQGTPVTDTTTWFQDGKAEKLGVSF